MTVNAVCILTIFLSMTFWQNNVTLLSVYLFILWSFPLFFSHIWNGRFPCSALFVTANSHCRWGCRGRVALLIHVEPPAASSPASEKLHQGGITSVKVHTVPCRFHPPLHCPKQPYYCRFKDKFPHWLPTQPMVFDGVLSQASSISVRVWTQSSVMLNLEMYHFRFNKAVQPPETMPLRTRRATKMVLATQNPQSPALSQIGLEMHSCF